MAGGRVGGGRARAVVWLAWPSLTNVGPRRKRPSRMNSAAVVLAALRSLPSSSMPFLALRAWPGSVLRVRVRVRVGG